MNVLVNLWAGLFKAGLRHPRVNVQFEFSLIIFVYTLMITYSKKNRQKLSEKCV